LVLNDLGEQDGIIKAADGRRPCLGDKGVELIQ
jgi:hypothetical protein